MEMMGLNASPNLKSRFTFPKLFIFLLTLLTLSIFGAACRNPRTSEGDDTLNPNTEQEGEAEDSRPCSALSGLPVTEEKGVFAVTIGNNPGARPQSGLGEADIVYEVLAEGGITRYMAIYHSRPAEKIGPVRSTRPYFALLAKEWDAVLGHCGGDPKDIQPLARWNVKDADEFKFPSLYWREDSRKAPDNLYTNTERLALASSEEISPPPERYDFGSWSESPLEAMKIIYSGNYTVQYVLNDGKYLRYLIENGTAKEHCDLDTDESLEISNVIIQFANHKVVYSDLGLEIDLVGSGEATYLLGGEYGEGTWIKEDIQSPTVFLDENGDKIKPVPGQTWIQIAPKNTAVTVSEAK